MLQDGRGKNKILNEGSCMWWGQAQTATGKGPLVAELVPESLLAVHFARNLVELQSGVSDPNRGKQNGTTHTSSRSHRACLIISMAFWRSSSEMTNGGENRILRKIQDSSVVLSLLDFTNAYVLTCVGLASTPRLLRRRQSCHAVRPRLLADSSMTTALNNPRPRTSLTSGERNALMPLRNCSPSLCARSESRSSTSTSNAVIATAQPSGFLSAPRRGR